MTTSSQPHTSIPLNKLVAWDGNVRKTNATAGIDELEASIAALGLLQSLVVRKSTRGKFAIIAGRRRYLALSSLAKSGAIDADAPIPCQIVSGSADATEISLTENIVRAPMHPADQFEAFHALVEAGSSPADVAARFGISETAVKQRLKLARVSPRVFAAYREGELTLEQVQAFAISDDHDAQDRVHADLTDWNNDPETIRNALTGDEIPLSDRRARYVTLAAYEAAGGGVRRDLFAQDDDGVFLLDAGLLDRLALQKLESDAEAIRAEGWKWVEAALQFDRSQTNYRTRHPQPVPLSAEAEAEQTRLAEQYQALFDSQDEHDEETTETLDALEAQMEALCDTEKVYTPETLAIAGAIVGIGHNGEMQVLRGLVAPEDEPEESPLRWSGAKERPEFSAQLVQQLTEARSAAIGMRLSECPDIALAATVHALVTCAFVHCERDRTLQLSGTVSHYRQPSPGAKALEEKAALWEERMPGVPSSARWEWCLAQDRETLLELLAFCAGRMVNAVQKRDDRPDCELLAGAGRLATALKLNMKEWFYPTAENYFSRVSKQQILADITEATQRPAKHSWDKLKKSELAAVAEREVAGSGWLPKPLRD
jgi:ParB family chromosome partitioning protein